MAGNEQARNKSSSYYVELSSYDSSESAINAVLSESATILYRRRVEASAVNDSYVKFVMPKWPLINNTHDGGHTYSVSNDTRHAKDQLSVSAVLNINETPCKAVEIMVVADRLVVGAAPLHALSRHGERSDINVFIVGASTRIPCCRIETLRRSPCKW